VNPGRVTARQLAGLLTLVLLVAVVTQGWQAWGRRGAERQLLELARPGDILMVSSLSCVFCTQARHWMSARNVPFDECFIERDEACAARYSALLAPGTPVLMVRGQRVLGFDMGRVAAALQAPPARQP